MRFPARIVSMVRYQGGSGPDLVLAGRSEFLALVIRAQAP